MTKGKYIKLIKLSAVTKPNCPTPAWKDYKVGEDNGPVSLPIEYTAEGYLLEDIKVGGIIRIDRRKRNNISTPGILSTTKIEKFRGNIVESKNSVYLIEEI